jgi:hypothetical protein
MLYGKKNSLTQHRPGEVPALWCQSSSGSAEGRRASCVRLGAAGRPSLTWANSNLWDSVNGFGMTVQMTQGR